MFISRENFLSIADVVENDNSIDFITIIESVTDSVYDYEVTFHTSNKSLEDEENNGI